MKMTDVMTDVIDPKVFDEVQPVRAVICLPTRRHTSKELTSGPPEMKMQDLHGAIRYITAEMNMLAVTERKLVKVRIRLVEGSRKVLM